MIETKRMVQVFLESKRMLVHDQRAKWRYKKDLKHNEDYLENFQVKADDNRPSKYLKILKDF